MIDPIPQHHTVAVLGLGAAGQAAVRLLAKLGKHVIASDRRASVDAALPAGVELRRGGNEIGDATAVVLSPGLNPEWPENRDNPALAGLWSAWREGRVQVWSEVELAIAAFGGPTITVGGTDGKSTTAAMTRDVAAAAGRRVLFGGNSWTALSDVLLETPDADICVAEVSAFQLWAGHGLRQDVAILTNIAPDHLDHYAGEDDYVAAKFHAFANMGAGTTAVLNAADARLGARRAALQARGIATVGFALDAPGPEWGARAWADERAFVVADRFGELRLPLSALQLPGAHNRKNALAALAAVRALTAGASPTATEAERALGDFRGLPHRLELVRELDGVLWLNDSKATNIHAAVTGLTSLDRPVVAIVGGVDKNLELAPLFDALDRGARHVVLIGGLTARFDTEAGARSWTREAAPDLPSAVAAARRAAGPGDAVVLAPACSSFDMFRSFEHRGDVFRTLVDALG